MAFKKNCVRLFCARFGKISAPLNSKHLGTLIQSFDQLSGKNDMVLLLIL